MNNYMSDDEVTHRCVACGFPLGRTNSPYCANHDYMNGWTKDCKDKCLTKMLVDGNDDSENER